MTVSVPWCCSTTDRVSSQHTNLSRNRDTVCNNKVVNGQLYTCTKEGTGKIVHSKICKRKGYRTSRKGVWWKEKKNLYRFLTHIYMCVCIYTTQNKQARCLVKSEHVLVPLKKINGKKQLGAPFGQVGCEQNCRNDKQKKELGHPESALTTCINIVAALHSQLI